MNYLSAKNLTKYYGERLLFHQLNLGINQGDKIALIANNGSGKSTLLNILVNYDSADEGEVSIHRGVRIGFLPQDPTFQSDLTIQELITSAQSHIQNIILSYQKALEDHSRETTPITQKELEFASARMDQTNAWDYDRQLKIILSKFNIHELDRKVGVLSGGEQKRLALALVLLDQPELLMLDEPTNHLDIELIEWLEKYLDHTKVTFLMVTHDRYFMDNVCNHIWELNGGHIYHHKGNYGYYLEKKAEREEASQTELGKAKKLLRKELEWMRRSPKARTTKAKARIHAFYQLKEKASQKAEEAGMKIDMKMKRLGGKILELHHISKQFGNQIILKDFSYTFNRGERIGIVGKNGTGKSTFLNILTGDQTCDEGQIKRGDTLQIGYYTQQGLIAREKQTVIDVLKEIAEVITLSNGRVITASQLLQHFMFTPKMQRTHVSKLSGGERRRLHLLRVLMKNPNFLILDEPTNDLDLTTLNKLEEFLSQFPGVLLMVSHDRYFLDNLVDHLFVFEGNGVVKDSNATYSEYRYQKLEETRAQAQTRKNEPADAEKERKEEERKKEIALTREFKKLEKEIISLESKKSSLEDEINKPGLELDNIMQLSGEIGKLVEIIEEKTERWMELADII